MKKTEWTSDMVGYLKTQYPTNTAANVAKALNVSTRSVYKKAKELNVNKDPAFLSAIRQAANKRLLEHGKAHRFKQGHTPANKGKSIVPTDGMKKTWYRKGHLPENTLYDGAIRIRNDTKGTPWKWIRISQNNWIHLHRKVWQDEFGDIPPGHVVAFKDGNTLNCAAENLFMLSKADNLRRNSIHQYPDEIKAAIRDLSKLKKTIKNAQK